jgi:predicted nucleotidyltransferase
MTEETTIIPVPDDLIQNWPTDVCDELITAINQSLATTSYLANKQPVTCGDVVVCGSRVCGGYTPTSDLDVVAYINDYVPPELPGRSYYRHRLVVKFRNLKMDLWLRCNDDKELGIFPGHPDAPTPLGWRLPYYSLVNKTVNQVYADEIEDYLRFMYSMKPRLNSPERRWDKLIVPIALPFQPATAL